MKRIEQLAVELQIAKRKAEEAQNNMERTREASNEAQKQHYAAEERLGTARQRLILYAEQEGAG